MIPWLLALALAPWSQPLSFGTLTGWHTGASGNKHSLYAGGARGAGPLESTAWIAKNVRYRDTATADPPSRTLAHLPADGFVVWAVIFAPALNGEKQIRLDLRVARHLACCDGPVRVAGGDLELDGSGPGHAYSVIVRAYFGGRPTPRLRAEAQRALDRLRLPAAR